MLDPKKDAQKLRKTWEKIGGKAPITSSVIESGVIISKWVILAIITLIVLIFIGSSIPGTPWNPTPPTPEESLKAFKPIQARPSGFIPKSGRLIAPPGEMSVRRKSTGERGTIPINKFNSDIFEAL